MPHLLLIPLILATLAVFAAPRLSLAQAETPVSQCQMIARSLPSVTFASFSGSAAIKVQAKAKRDITVPNKRPAA